MRLKDKVAIVTGGSSGIGEAIALGFAREGAKVTIAGRRAGQVDLVCDKIRKAGGEALAAPGDVTSLTDIDRIVTETVNTFGKLDILVNNAGVLISADVSQTSEKVWDETLNINLKGTFFFVKRAVPEMLKQADL